MKRAFSDFCYLEGLVAVRYCFGDGYFASVLDIAFYYGDRHFRHGEDFVEDATFFEVVFVGRIRTQGAQQTDYHDG